MSSTQEPKPPSGFAKFFGEFFAASPSDLSEDEKIVQKAWRLSPQRALARRNSIAIYFSGIIFALAAMGAFYLNESEYLQSFIWIIVAYFTIMITMAATVYQMTEKRRQFQVEYSLNQLAEENADQDSIALGALWKANKNQLGHYHKIVMNYAESTKRSTRWYLIVGFLFVVVTGAMSLFATRTDTAIASTVVAAAAAALTGFVANAVLRNASTASSELQMFFNHPLEVERALAAERLVGEFETPERRDEARLLIIQSLTRERPQLRAAPSDFTASGGTEPTT